MVILQRFRLVLWLLLAASVGCHAQNTAAPQNPATPSDLDRRIISVVRSRFGVPPEYNITVGKRSKSDVTGYDTVQVTFSRGDKSSSLNFLVSQDGKTLAKLDTYDITKEPDQIVSAVGRPERGNAEAKVTIVNFDDLECPFCARMHSELFSSTANRYKGLVRIVYKDYPLVEIHPWAMHAAVNANCLADQNPTAYWNFVDYVHAHGAEVGTGRDMNVATASATLDRLTREEGKRQKLDAAKLDACIAKQDDALVRKEMAEGDKLNVDSTPVMFVNGIRVVGAQPEDVLWPTIDRALTDAGVTPPPPATPAAAGTTVPHGGR